MSGMGAWPARHECLDALRCGTGAGVTVAILDTGIDTRHPDFATVDFQGTWQVTCDGECFQVQEAEPCDLAGHGTSIAGIIHRMAPQARIMSIAVLDPRLRQYRHEAICRAAEHALRKGANLLNCSFGVPGTTHTLPVYRSWTGLAFRQRVPVIAASSALSAEWPASFEHVIGVAAEPVSPECILHRPHREVAFAAAGSEIPVPVPGGGHRLVSGSSFAAAHVSGLLSRLLSTFPTLSPSLAREALEALACSSTTTTTSTGILR